MEDVKLLIICYSWMMVKAVAFHSTAQSLQQVLMKLSIHSLAFYPAQVWSEDLTDSIWRLIIPMDL